MYERPRFVPAGDQTLVVELGDRISPEINRRVHNLMSAVQEAEVPGVRDLVPTYRSLLVHYDPLTTSHDELRERVEPLEAGLRERPPSSPRVIQLPTLYGGEYGPDLGFVAEHAGMSVDEVIEVHSGTDYLVYMMGFSPGFPYLGGLSEELATPRLATPRTEIPAGSVGIAENQTGVYPVASPGGWQLIGRTPLDLFDPDREPPALVGAGDYVRFLPLDGAEQYLDIRGQAAAGEYNVVAEHTG